MAKNDHTDKDSLLADPRFHAGLRKLMESEDFRYFCRGLLGMSGVRQSPFTGNALTSAHAAGFQQAGLNLEYLLSQAAPELFLQMLKEHYDEQIAE